MILTKQKWCLHGVKLGSMTTILILKLGGKQLYMYFSTTGIRECSDWVNSNICFFFFSYFLAEGFTVFDIVLDTTYICIVYILLLLIYFFKGNSSLISTSIGGAGPAGSARYSFALPTPESSKYIVNVVHVSSTYSYFKDSQPLRGVSSAVIRREVSSCSIRENINFLFEIVKKKQATYNSGRCMIQQ